MLLVITGNRFVGKKTVAAALSKKTGIHAMPIGSFRIFHKDERQAWEQFLKLLRTMDTSSIAPADSIILVGVQHDREFWQLLPSSPFQHLMLLKLEAPLAILRERLAKRLRPYENLEILYERMLVPGQAWSDRLAANFAFDTSAKQAEEIAEHIHRALRTKL
jgi:deoxyadenosine/deoxycytidine kinase